MARRLPNGALLLPGVQASRAHPRRRDRRSIRGELGFHPHSLERERPRRAPQRGPAAVTRGAESSGASPSLKRCGARWTLHVDPAPGPAPAARRDPEDRPLRTRQPPDLPQHAPRIRDGLAPLRAGGAVIADDVERNRAFGELQQKDPGLWRVVRDRETSPLHGKAAPVVFGIAIK